MSNQCPDVLCPTDWRYQYVTQKDDNGNDIQFIKVCFDIHYQHASLDSFKPFRSADPCEKHNIIDIECIQCINHHSTKKKVMFTPKIITHSIIASHADFKTLPEGGGKYFKIGSITIKLLKDRQRE